MRRSPGSRPGYPSPLRKQESGSEEVALAMHLSDASVLRFDQLDSVPLESVSAPDRTEICEVLVLRAMLQKRDEGYTFIHRIIGESLAAEALLRVPPRVELLDAIAPAPSATLHGVRPDWRVPMALLLPNSPAWLDAIKVRDPLQWARSVPSTASVETRQEAAEMIWKTYLDWRIWIWDYGAPDIVQDGPALARLLRAGELEHVIAEIRSGINDSSPQTQGNAIRVLSLAEVDHLADDLGEVLRDSAREPVIRRQAALAAADLGFTELLDLIVDQAVHSTDSVEAQDCAASALRLAPTNKVEDVAQTLFAEQGESNRCPVAHRRVTRSKRDTPSPSQLRGKRSAPDVSREGPRAQCD